MVDAKAVINGTVDASLGAAYTTNGGANIISEGAGKVTVASTKEGVTYQLVQNTGYTEIPVSSAKLKNADGFLVDTSKVAGVIEAVEKA